MFTNSSRQLRRITEQSTSMLKVSQNGNTIQHLSFLPSKKAKHIMVDMRSTQPLKTSDIFECNTQLVVFILNELQLFILDQTKVLFIRKIPISTKNTFHKSTRKVKRQKTIMCSSWSKRHSSPSNLLFLEKLQFPRWHQN